MSIPINVSSEPEGPAGHTYAAVLVRVGERSDGREQVITSLRRLRFTGWVAPLEDGWVPVIPAGAGTVAAGRRGVVGVGEALAEQMTGPVVAARVLADRQLVLVAWESGQEVARYVSDPSREPDAEADVLPYPFGTEGADAVAAVCDRSAVIEELGEVLSEGLDPDQHIESERLGRVLRLLGLPSWLVSSWRLPRAMATGPAPRRMLRLRAGRTGVSGWVVGRAVRLARRWRTPPPVLPDPPRGNTGIDDDLAMWL
jgi:hypothetical protein